MKLQESVMPLSNVEKQLATLAGEYSGCLDAPKSTVEAYLANILGTYTVDLPSPISKIEKYLGSMVGVYESDVFPRPIYSTELYFASYAGLWDGTEDISHRAADPAYPQMCRYTWYGYSSFGYHGMPVMCDIFRFSNDPNIRELWVVTLSERDDRTWLYFWVDRSIDTQEKFHALMMGHQILYVKNEAVNLPIPNFADVVSEFKNLTSYKDSTDITNDEDAFMAATIKVREKSMYKMRRKAVRYE